MENKSGISETAQVLNELVAVFEDLAIDYFLTGSLASGVRGEFRATNDIDVVAKIDRAKINLFVKMISVNFFAQEKSIQDAIENNKSFNIIHKEFVLKVDIFTEINDLANEQLSRATKLKIPSSDLSLSVATSEDIILSKLIWYKKGNQQSERQWRDILGVIAVTGLKLDNVYLFKWASKLGLVEMLELAFKDAKN